MFPAQATTFPYSPRFAAKLLFCAASEDGSAPVAYEPAEADSEVEEEAAHYVKLVVDEDVIDHAKRLANPIFEPEYIRYKKKSIGIGRFAIESLLIVTSNDVASLTVNGTALQKVTSTYQVTARFGSMRNLEKEFGVDIDGGEYTVWLYTASAKSELEIVAYDCDGTASEPIAATNNSGNLLGFLISSILGNLFGNNSVESDSSYEASKIMQGLADRHFAPEKFDAELGRRADGKNQLIIEVSDDVEYVIVNGNIIKHYITETVVDLEHDGTETVKRIFAVCVDGEDPVEVTAYDAEGVASSAQAAQN
ncbi:MAG: hypothetical protein ACI3XI_03205 [Eubacteriales bacterium]